MSYFSYIFFFLLELELTGPVCGKLLELLMKVKPISALAMTFSTRTVCQPAPRRENRGGGVCSLVTFMHKRQ